MNHQMAAPVPGGIAQLQRQLEQFRSSRPARTKLPESLWQAAVELARQHGIICRGASATVGLYPAEAAAERNAEPAKKTKQTSIC